MFCVTCIHVVILRDLLVVLICFLSVLSVIVLYLISVIVVCRMKQLSVWNQKQRNKHQHAQINKITDISFLSKTLISFSFCVFHFADPLCNKINARLNCLQIYSVIICYHRVNTGSFILFYCCQVTKNWRFFITNFSLCF